MSQLSARLSARGTLLKICYTVAAVFVAADAFDCGQPLGPCGEAVPAGVTCPKGAGWCTAGYYCGRDRKGDSKVKCMHLPENCGTAGYDCCPSNAETPHTSDTDTSSRTPFCKDGSTCVFDPDSRWTSISPDPHEGVRGSAIPANCSTTANSPCCPSSCHTAFNPPLRKSQCPEDHFCELDSPLAAKYPGSDLLTSSQGVCLPNAPDCGEEGKPCCISNGWSTTNIVCLARPAGKGPEGYCATADGKVYGKGVMLKDLMCKRCPANEESLRQSQPDVYKECT